jgi:DNA polymerase III delta subunit
MLSKWQLWDFFQSYPKSSWPTLKGRVILQAFDPLAARLMRDHLLHGLNSESKPRQISGSDVTISWIEDQFLSLGLFGNAESWLINSPDDMSAAVKEKILEADLMLDGRSLGFLFHSDSAYLKKILKSQGLSHVQIEAPRFWESAKLVDFLTTFFQLPLRFEAKQYLLQAVENEFMPLFDAFRLIKLNFPESRDVTLSNVQELIGVDRLDQFALATDMGKKSWKTFFERLLSIEPDFERWRGIFSFLQGHLIRIADPSYLGAKSRLSKYDQEIQTLARGWRPQEVTDMLTRLQDWEIACKSKDPYLHTQLRQALLESHQGSWLLSKV